MGFNSEFKGLKVNVGETIAVAIDASGNYDATVRQTDVCNSYWHGQVTLTFFSQ